MRLCAHPYTDPEFALVNAGDNLRTRIAPPINARCLPINSPR